MKYGRLVGGILEHAPNIITITIANPTEEQLIEQGYCPIVTAEKPEKEGYVYTPVYAYDKEQNTIVQSFKEEAIPTDPLLEDRMDSIEETVNGILTGGEINEAH